MDGLPKNNYSAVIYSPKPVQTAVVWTPLTYYIDKNNLILRLPLFVFHRRKNQCLGEASP